MKKVLIVLLASLLALFSTCVFAFGSEGSRLDFQLSIGSVHSADHPYGLPWNKNNAGVAVQYVTPGTFRGADVEYCITAGQVKNSEFRQTKYAGGCIRKTIFEFSSVDVSIGAFAGGLTYPSIYNTARSANQVFPAILPTISACTKKGFCIDAIIIPEVKGKTVGTVALFALRFPFYKW